MKYTTEESAPLSASNSLTTLLKGYVALSKLRLSSLVVFSAIMGYMTAAPGPWDWQQALLLGLGGLLITASANGFNQIFEREPDKLMARTCQRPLATNKMTVLEALIFCMSTGVIGLIVLGFYFGFLAFLLGLVALLSYAFVYTPMKRISPISVLIGAFPGAIPPLLGYVAFTGQVSTEAWILFALQFVWQFPHFWSIAWLLHDDYSKAGFKMLPHAGGQNQRNATTILIYTFMLFPIGLLPLRYEMAGPIAITIILISSLYMFVCAFFLFRNCSLQAARQLMFSSFVYLPAVQMALVFDKI
jgi:protoheme IX farnesyltransferase